MELRINEILGPTIQGEGILTGCPSMFVRVQGCSLRCPRCDTKRSWERKGSLMSLTSIERRLQRHPDIDVVITGGEPLMDDHIVAVEKLTRSMYSKGRRVTIETSGQYARQEPLSSELLRLVYLWSVSPKLSAMGFSEPQANSLFASRVAASGRHVQLKFVVSPQTLDEDLDMVRSYMDLYNVRGVYPTVYILFQVATEIALPPAEAKQQILNDWAALTAVILEVRWLRPYRPQILPQAHRLIGVD